MPVHSSHLRDPVSAAVFRMWLEFSHAAPANLQHALQAIHAAAQAVMSGVHDCCGLS